MVFQENLLWFKLHNQTFFTYIIQDVSGEPSLDYVTNFFHLHLQGVSGEPPLA